MRRRRAHRIAALTAVLVVAACRAKVPVAPPEAQAPAPEPTPVLSGIVEETVRTATATVLRVDPRRRVVTLRGPDGTPFAVAVSERAGSLARIRKGDIVSVAYYDAIAYDVRRAGTGEAGEAEAVAVGGRRPGEKPGGYVAEVSRVTATVSAIDRDAPNVTLRVPGGIERTIAVRDRSKLDKVQVGDLVDIFYSEALAISVDAPAK